MAQPMGEAKPSPPWIDFERRLKLEYRGRRLASDAGLLARRAAAEVLGL